MTFDELKAEAHHADWMSRDRAMREQVDRDVRMAHGKVDIHITPEGRGSTISIDGQQLPMVHAFSVQVQPNKASRVLVEFVGVDVSITGSIARRNMIAADLNPEHARLVVHTPTQDVVQFEDGHFEVVSN